MRVGLLAVGLFVFAVPAVIRQAPPLFNPVGKWTVSTTGSNGQPTTVTVDIAGRLGAYTGSATTAEGQTLTLRELATTPRGMIAVFDLPQGAVFVRMVRDAAGKFSGTWGETAQVVPFTAIKGD